MTPTTWTPELKATVSRMIAAGHRSDEIAAVIGMSRQSILSGNKRHNLGQFELGHKAQIPPEVKELWPTHSIREIAEKLGANRGSISRWGRTLGLPSKLARDTEKARRTNNKKPNRGVFKASGPQAPLERYSYEDSPVGEAHRQCQKYAPTFRVSGGWRYGSAFLTNAELIDRADFLRSREARRA